MAANKKYGLLITGDSKSAVKALKLTDEQLKQLNVRQRRTASQAKKTQGVMSNYIKIMGAAGVAGALTVSVKSAAAFEKKMAEISTLLDDTSSLDAITESVRNMATEFGGDVIQQSSAMYSIISAGASDAAEATDILTAANKLAIGGVTDVATAADGLTSILNAYGDQVGGATEVSDAMFAAMKAGKTTIGELSASIGSVAPIAAQTGVSLTELLAATATLTKGGVSTSEAMTGLQGVMAAVIKPTSQATKIAKELGIEFNLQSLKAKGLAGFIAHVTEKTDGNAASMAQLFGRVEGLTKVMALSGSQAEDYAEVLESVTNSAGQTEIAFAKMTKTFDFNFDKLIANFKNVGLSLGNDILPYLTRSTIELNKFFEALNNATLGEEGFNDALRDADMKAATASIEKHKKALVSLNETLSTLQKAQEASGESQAEAIAIVTEKIDKHNSAMSAAEGVYKKAASGADTFSNAVNEVSDELDKAIASIDDLDKVEKKAEKSIKAATAGIDKQSKATKDKSKVTQQINDDLDDFFKKEMDASKATSDYTKDIENQIRVLNIRISSGDAAAEAELEWIRVQEAGIDVTREQVIAYQEQIESLENVLAETQAAADQWEEIWSNAIENMQRAFGDLIYDNMKSMLDDGELSFKAFTDTLLDMFLRMIADMVAAWAAAKFASMFSGSGGLLGGIANYITAAKGASTASQAMGSSIANVGTIAAAAKGIYASYTGSIINGATAAQSAVAAYETAMAGSEVTVYALGDSYLATAEAIELTGTAMEGAAVATEGATASTAGLSSGMAMVGAATVVAVLAFKGWQKARREEEENSRLTDQFNDLRLNTEAFAGELVKVSDQLTIVGQNENEMYLNLTGTYEQRSAQMAVFREELNVLGVEQRQIYDDQINSILMVTGSMEQLAIAEGIVAAGFDNADLQFTEFKENSITGLSTLTASFEGSTADWEKFLTDAMNNGELSATQSFKVIEDSNGDMFIKMNGNAEEWANFLKNSGRIGTDSVSSNFQALDSDGENMFQSLTLEANAFQSVLDSITAKDLEAVINYTIRSSGEVPTVDGSHALGLDYVPFDGYVAELHKGEKVLTADENRSGDSGLVSEIKALRQDQARQQNEIKQLIGQVVSINRGQLNEQQKSTKALEKNNSMQAASVRR